VPAAADNDLDTKISEASDDLADASKAVSAANAALEAARTQLPAAQAEVRAATIDVDKAKAVGAAAADAAEKATSQALSAQEKMIEAQARITDMDGQIGDLARAVYTQGPYAELAAILDATTPSEFADRLEAIRSVSRSQNRTLADLNVARADFALAGLQAEQARVKAEATRQVAADALKDAARAATRAKAAKAKVEALVAARAEALAVAAREKAKVKRQYEALKAEQRRLKALEQGPGGYTGTPTGGLAWPIPGGVVVQGTGPRIHPVYGYRSCHTGVDIRGSYGTPIRAAAAGKVLSVQNGGPYGLHTVISHGGGISTMTAHQSRVNVRTGQVVSQGQVIGYVGTSGWVTGAHLHWEVHVNGVPYNPMGWFGGVKAPVPC
jgi:murein DD-endopeptidase MepM/ murein hydrolase activator NlpD